MVTAEEIGRIEIFAALGPEQRERLAARRGRHQARARASTPPGRDTSGRSSRVLEGRIEAVKTVDGIERVVGERSPGTSSARCRSRWGPSSRSGSGPPRPRACCGSSRPTTTPSPPRSPDVAQGGRRARDAPDRRAGRAAGDRRRAAAAAGDRRRQPLGRRVRGAAPLPRPQPDLLPLACAGGAGGRRGVGRTAAGRGRSAGDQGRRRQDGRPPAAAPRRRAARGDHRAGRGRVRHGRRRRRPGRARGRGLRRLGGALHARRRARGARAARPAPRRGSRTTSASRPASRATSSRAGRCSRRGGSAPRSSSPGRSRGSTPRRARSTSTAATCSAPARSSSPAASRGGSSRSRASTGSSGKGIFYGAARSEAPQRARPRRPHRRRGNSAGQAALHFSTHARSVTILCRGDGPREEHVALPDRPARDPVEHRRRCRGPRSWAPTGTARWRRSTSATGDAAGRRASGRAACSSSSAPTRRPAGCRPRSRSTRAASCSPAPTCATPGAGSSSAIPICSRRACPGIFACGDVRFGPVKRVAAAVGEGSMAIAFVHQYLRET